MSRSQDLQCLLDEARERHGVVGASLAVLQGDRVTAASSGLLNLETGVKVTNDSVFQIGSITKVFTATLIMQLLDQGRLDLDQPVKTFLPAFELADSDAASQITIRHLLTHTSGMEGDFFPEDDPFGPSIAGFVNRCRLLPQLHPAGERFSYCNTAYTIAGRVVEVVTGLPWHQAVEQRILRPLGMSHSLVDPRDALRFRMAMGHMPDPGEPSVQRLAEHCYLPLSHAPAGALLSMSAADLLAFAKMHLGGGLSEEGNYVLSQSSVRKMQQEQVAVPRHSPSGMSHWGLGWIIGTNHPTKVLSHYGGTLGQLSYLRVFPEHQLSIVLLTNSLSMPMYEELEEKLLREIAGITLAKPQAKAHKPADFGRYTGSYENIAQRVSIVERDGVLFIDRVHRGDSAAATSSCLQPFDTDCFEEPESSSRATQRIHFVDSDQQGRARYLSTGFRLLKRVNDPQ